MGAFFAFVYGYYFVGGILAQASSIVDGIDGDQARLKRMTSAIGGYMDSILVRYADTLIILGLTIWAAGVAITSLRMDRGVLPRLGVIPGAYESAVR